MVRSGLEKMCKRHRVFQSKHLKDTDWFKAMQIDSFSSNKIQRGLEWLRKMVNWHRVILSDAN